MTGPALHKRLAAEDRRRQILEAAAELFVARGFEAVTMTDLAQMLHVSRPTMYTYFASPEAVLDVLLGERLQAFWTGLEEQLTRLLPPATSPLPPQLPPHLFSSLLTFLVGERATLSLLHCGGGPAFQHRRLAFLDELAARLATLRPDVRRSPYLLMLLTQLLGSVALRVTLLPPDQPDALAEALDAFVRGGSAMLLEGGATEG
ncbi:TetR/AcrR family transcriptional regulator [Deinococcus rubellus]|uniref:TetR/AcrR family transcriptional regulator n=1 Tax=Deinococcus rubellus TaxID=1889240 RepID=A0ABY5YHG3_9DEIO|nr:TetR/AcrR family transcriptional regulator [Deinococcus rubellus]UWX63537.1 TetR/AcrR family transcriptional regulator [Deinococcus rubellus]